MEVDMLVFVIVLAKVAVLVDCINEVAKEPGEGRRPGSSSKSNDEIGQEIIN
jgi:hypothetical protein